MYVLQIETLTNLITLNACLFVATISSLEIVVSHILLSSVLSLERGLASDVLVWNDVAELLVDLLSAVNHVHELSALVALVDLARADDLVLWVLDELIPMSQPACKTGQGEHNREHLRGDSEGFIDHTRVEIDVGVELAGDKVLVLKGDALKFHGNVDHGLTTNDREDIVGESADKSSSWVKVLVDSVTESHEDLLAGLDVLDELRDSLNGTDLIEHAEHGLVGSSMARSIEGSDCTSKRGVHVRLRGSHVTNSCGGTVKFMLSMEDKKNVDSLDDLRMRPEV